jgi:hypothetical protein
MGYRVLACRTDTRGHSDATFLVVDGSRPAGPRFIKAVTIPWDTSHLLAESAIAGAEFQTMLENLQWLSVEEYLILTVDWLHRLERNHDPFTSIARIAVEELACLLP